MGLLREITHNTQQMGQETRGAGEGRTKQWGTEISGDLWKGEGLAGEHRVNKMDTTGTFRSLHNRELLGRKAGNLKEVGLGWINEDRKDRGFMGGGLLEIWGGTYRRQGRWGKTKEETVEDRKTTDLPAVTE